MLAVTHWVVEADHSFSGVAPFTDSTRQRYRQCTERSLGVFGAHQSQLFVEIVGSSGAVSDSLFVGTRPWLSQDPQYVGIAMKWNLGML
jgi:hypothetical protein